MRCDCHGPADVSETIGVVGIHQDIVTGFHVSQLFSYEQKRSLDAITNVIW